MIYTTSKIELEQQCPRKYEGTYITKTIPFIDSEASKKGKQYHNFYEMALKEKLAKGQLPHNITTNTAWTPTVQKVMDYITKLGGTTYVEWKFALAHDGAPIEIDQLDTYWSPVTPGDSHKIRYRMKIDVVAIYQVTGVWCAFIVDWKTGKVRDLKKFGQLEFYTSLIMRYFPKVQHVEAVFAYVEHAHVDVRIYKRADLPAINNFFDTRIRDIETRARRNSYPPKESYLCKWCNIPKRLCEFK